MIECILKQDVSLVDMNTEEIVRFAKDERFLLVKREPVLTILQHGGKPYVFLSSWFEVYFNWEILEEEAK